MSSKKNKEYGLEVKKSKVAGKGLFTTIPRKKNEFICYYGGEKLNRKQFSKKYKKKSPIYAFQVTKDYYIDADKTTKSYGRYVNSSKGTGSGSNCKFSVSPQKIISIKSTKRILPGKELLISYGRSYKIL